MTTPEWLSSKLCIRRCAVCTQHPPGTLKTLCARRMWLPVTLVDACKKALYWLRANAAWDRDKYTDRVILLPF